MVGIAHLLIIPISHGREKSDGAPGSRCILRPRLQIRLVKNLLTYPQETRKYEVGEQINFKKKEDKNGQKINTN